MAGISGRCFSPLTPKPPLSGPRLGGAGRSASAFMGGEAGAAGLRLSDRRAGAASLENVVVLRSGRRGRSVQTRARLSGPR